MNLGSRNITFIRFKFLFALSFFVSSFSVNAGGLELPECALQVAALYKSKVLAPILQTAEEFAVTPFPILILGPTGAGKTAMAAEIHAFSNRPGPFRAINITAIPHELLESELFGHKKGAFTGAVTSRNGVIFDAKGGTLFLDEIGDLSPDAQVKLLRFLDEKKVRPVGSNEEISVDVRLIAATHQDLRALVRERKFREDLFYRLQVLELTLPSLKAWDGEVIQLAEHILKSLAITLNKPAFELSAAAAEKIKSYTWPGNIRELQNVLTRAAVLTRGQPEISSDLIELPKIENFTVSPFASPNSTTSSSSENHVIQMKDNWSGEIDLKKGINLLRRHFVISALSQTRGEQSSACRLLRISRTELRGWLQALNLSPEDFKNEGTPIPLPDISSLPFSIDTYLGAYSSYVIRLETVFLKEAFRLSGYKISGTAKLLGITRPTVKTMMDRLNIEQFAQ